MNSLAYSSAPIPLGDSSRDFGDLRAFLAEAFAALFRSLVLFMVRGLSQWADRTPLRNQLILLDVARGPHDSAQPELAWTITPVARNCFIAVLSKLMGSSEGHDIAGGRRSQRQSPRSATGDPASAVSGPVV